MKISLGIISTIAVVTYANTQQQHQRRRRRLGAPAQAVEHDEVPSHIRALSLRGCFETKEFLKSIVDFYFSNTGTAIHLFGEIGTWCVSPIEDFSYLFENNDFFNEPLDGWDMSNAISVRGMFKNSAFNQDISMWNLKKVKDMSEMFDGASSFQQDVCDWNIDLSAMTLTSSAFDGTACPLPVDPMIKSDGSFTSLCYPCESVLVTTPTTTTTTTTTTTPAVTRSTLPYSMVTPDPQDRCYTSKSQLKNDIKRYLNDPAARNELGEIGSWCVSKITDFDYLFSGRNAPNFNEPLHGWDTSNAESMVGMFFNAKQFNQDISNWKVSNVKNMNSMFNGAGKFNQDLNKWDVSSVTSMASMFSKATAFNGDISTWNVGKVTNMGGMFRSAKTFNVDIGRWNVGSVTNMASMFIQVIAFNQDINAWNVSRVTDMGFMFRSAESFNSPLDMWDVENVQKMYYTFNGAFSFNQDISQWNLRSVTSISGMFQAAYTFDQDLCSWGPTLVLNNAETNSVFVGSSCESPFDPFSYGQNGHLCTRSC